MSIRKTIFGRNKYSVNTFIGGVSASVSTPALAAAKLGITANRIKSFSIIGEDIQFSVIDGTYSIGDSAFRDTSSPCSYFRDTGNICVGVGNRAFFQNANLKDVLLNAVKTIGNRSFINCPSIQDYSFPSLLNITNGVSGGTFQNNNALKTFSAPLLTTVTNSAVIWCNSNSSSLVSFYAPKLATLGTPQSDYSFYNIKAGATITVSSALQTNNNGEPDGDLVYASGTRGATIVYI
jgi:hypothetical protein